MLQKILMQNQILNFQLMIKIIQMSGYKICWINSYNRFTSTRCCRSCWMLQRGWCEKVFMVIGDHPTTATAIARQIGIIGDSIPDQVSKQKKFETVSYRVDL